MNNKPCRALILVTINGASKTIRVAGCNYGAARHADRWLARGAEKVIVFLFSKSTGREISRVESLK